MKRNAAQDGRRNAMAVCTAKAGCGLRLVAFTQSVVPSSGRLFDVGRRLLARRLLWRLHLDVLDQDRREGRRGQRGAVFDSLVVPGLRPGLDRFDVPVINRVGRSK